MASAPPTRRRPGTRLGVSLALLALVAGTGVSCGNAEKTAVDTGGAEQAAPAPAVGDRIGGLIGDIKPDETVPPGTDTTVPEETTTTTPPPIVVQAPPTTSGPRPTVYVPPPPGNTNTGPQPTAFSGLTDDENKVLARVRSLRGTANPEADLMARARSMAAASQLADPNILNNLQVRWKYVNQANAYGGPTINEAMQGLTGGSLTGPGSWVGIGVGSYAGQILIVVITGDY